MPIRRSNVKALIIKGFLPTGLGPGNVRAQAPSKTGRLRPITESELVAAGLESLKNRFAGGKTA